MYTKEELRKLGEHANKKLENLLFHIDNAKKGILEYAKSGDTSYTESILHDSLSSEHIEIFINSIKCEYLDINLEINTYDTSTHYTFSWND